MAKLFFEWMDKEKCALICLQPILLPRIAFTKGSLFWLVLYSRESDLFQLYDHPENNKTHQCA